MILVHSHDPRALEVRLVLPDLILIPKESGSETRLTCTESRGRTLKPLRECIPLLALPVAMAMGKMYVCKPCNYLKAQKCCQLTIYGNTGNLSFGIPRVVMCIEEFNKT